MAWKTIPALSASILAFGVSAATSQTTMTDLDTDADGQVSAEEWKTRMSSDHERFSQYDEDQSGDISEEEWDRGEFIRYDTRYDTKGAGMIDETEFQASIEARGQENTAGALSDFDTDADSMLSQEEFRASTQGSTTATFGAYDVDQSDDVTAEEFISGEFRRLDTNQDEQLNEEEFGRYETEASTQSN